MNWTFRKMHGLGNDFVVLDGRTVPLDPSVAQIRAISDRRTGVGCDQLIVLDPPRTAGTAVFMRILNADGSEVGACGNATRCIATLLMAESRQESCTIETLAGLLEARLAPGGVTVDLGPARLDWREIPLARPEDTLALDITLGPLSNPVAVSMGNPHAVFFVPRADDIPLSELGPVLEYHPLFPQRTNVEVVEVLDSGESGMARLRMRVWERGAGITRACGTGAAATTVAAARRGLLRGRRAQVVLDGGTLEIEWLANGHVLMTGPAVTSFTGTLEPGLEASAPLQSQGSARS